MRVNESERADREEVEEVGSIQLITVTYELN